MKDSTNHFLMRVINLFMWRGKLAGQENLPRVGPAVFIANHLETIGPIAAVSSIPLRLHVWSNMLDEENSVELLKLYFAERTLHLKPPISDWVAKTLSKITVPLMGSLDYIPIHVGDYRRMADTLSMSVNLLRQGKFLLLFPEDGMLPADPLTGINQFTHIFPRLGEMYYQQTGTCLQFYPVAIHAQKRRVMVGQPVAFNPLNPVGLERRRLRDLMEGSIKTMYLLPDPLIHAG